MEKGTETRGDATWNFALNVAQDLFQRSKAKEKAASYWLVPNAATKANNSRRNWNPYPK
jgi:1,2-phenylacetyl-CoA epoxidase PaaB subunit